VLFNLFFPFHDLSPCSLLHLITHLHTLGRTPLDEGSACRRDLCDNTSQESDNHAPGGIRTRSPSKRTAADRRLTTRGRLVRHSTSGKMEFLNVTAGWACRIAVAVGGSRHCVLCSYCCVVWGLACADSPSSSASESSVSVAAPRAITVFTRHTNLSSLFYRRRT
jgi:hypothetical protein